MFGKNPTPSFHATNAVEVHKDVLAAFSKPDSVLYNITCQFPATGLGVNLDKLYPFTVHGQSSTETLDELVEWWQAPWVSSESMPDFNHGSRINGTDSDWQQISAIIATLKASPYTTKAHIVLQHHRPGYSKTHGHPAMCEVFVCIRKQSGGADLLDVTAVFRKQEMRYWWIVNVREVAAIQQAIIKGLNGPNFKVEAGLITTFTIRAVVNKQDVPPLVAVHALDRAARVRPGIISQMCAGLVKTKPAAGDKERWHYYLDDLKPSSERDPDGFPVCVTGLKELASSIDLVANALPPFKPGAGKPLLARDPKFNTLKGLSKILNELARLNAGMVRKLRKGGKNEVSDEDYEEWKAACENLIEKAKGQASMLAGV